MVAAGGRAAAGPRRGPPQPRDRDQAGRRRRRRFRRAWLSDGSEVEADVAVVALGAVRNPSGSAARGSRPASSGSPATSCRAFTLDLIVTDDVFVAGDVAPVPHPLYRHQFLALEHWSNAVDQARVAAHNMICEPRRRRPHFPVPSFWSSQFGVNIKSVGVPSAADEVMIARARSRRAVSSRSMARMATRWPPSRSTRAAGSSPMRASSPRLRRSPSLDVADPPAPNRPVPAGLPDEVDIRQQATAVLTGHDVSDRGVQWSLKRPKKPVAGGSKVMPDSTILKRIFDYKSRATRIPSSPSCERRRSAGRRMARMRRAPGSSAPTGTSSSCSTTPA